jgi:hypothetical protein
VEGRDRSGVKVVVQVVVAAVALIALALVVVGFAFPSRWTAERSLLVNAQPSTIHGFVRDLRTWPAWADAPVVANAEFVYGGPDDGPGAYRTWRDVRGLVGRTDILREEPDAGVWFRSSMGEGEPTVTAGSITYRVEAAGTAIVWRDEGELPRPFGAYFKDSVERDVRARFDRGLQALKQLAEAQERGEAPADGAQPVRR